MLSMRPSPYTHWPWLLWHHIEKQHWSTCGTSTLLLPFLPFPASLYVSRFMGDSGLHILHLSSCQTSRNRRSHLRLLYTLIAYKMIMLILNMAWYPNMGLFYFSPAIKFSIFYQLCLESVFSQNLLSSDNDGQPSTCRNYRKPLIEFNNHTRWKTD